MTRYERIVSLLDQAIGGPGANIGAHGPFWRGLTRDQFVAKQVFSRALLVVGNGAESNLVKALKGEVPFGSDLPNASPDAIFPRMPDGFPPVSDDDIAFVRKWIDEGCLEDPFVPDAGMPHPDPSEPPAPMAWRPTNAPAASSRYDDVWFHEPQNGWAVNSNGEIRRTQDGGDSWPVQLHDPSVYMRCIAFASATRGWVGTLTDGKILYETRDGGDSWSLVANLPADAPVAVCGMWAANESIVYAAGSNHPEQPVRMMKTTDGGQTWTAWDMRRWADNLIDVYFPTASRGWVVGGRTDDRTDPAPSKPKLRPVILYTEDGGQTWVDRVEAIRDQFPLGEWGWKIQFLDDRVGFISLQNYDLGAILTTVDGGITWTRRPIRDPQMNANLEGIGFIDDRHGWVGGWGDRPKQKRTSSETLDGGLTWRDANEIGRTINRFRFLGTPIQVGYAAGERVYKYAPATADTFAARQPDERRTETRLLDTVEPFDGAGQASLAVTVPPQTARLTVRIWDPDGPMVRLLIDEAEPAAGRRMLTWDRTDADGRVLPPRSYIWRATVDDVSESRLVFIR